MSYGLRWTRPNRTAVRSAEAGVGVEEFLKSAGYGAIFALSFISAMGLPVGAELALIFGGVLASGHVTLEASRCIWPWSSSWPCSARSSVRWPATASAASAAGRWSTRSGSTCS